MFDILLQFHGFLRWVVLALGVAGLAAVLVERARAREESSLARVAGTAFTASLDLQLALGVLLLILGSGFAGVLWHVVVMLAAVVLVHVFRIRARRASGDGRVVAGVLSYVAPLVLILVGIRLLV